MAHSVELLGETDHYLIIGDLSHGPREEDRLDWTAVEFGRLCLLGDGHQLRWHPVSYLRTPADWYLANEGFTTAMRGELVPLSPSSSWAALSGSLSSSSKSSRSVQTKLTSCTLLHMTFEKEPLLIFLVTAGGAAAYSIPVNYIPI